MNGAGMSANGMRLLLLSGCLATVPVLAQDADLGEDVSEYRRFVIYPHLHRGFQAMARGDRDVAIAEFERARALAPRNPQTALYLAEAYRRFGMLPRARELLAQQAAFTPGDARFSTHPTLPAQVTQETQAEHGSTCTDMQTDECRSQSGYRALGDGDLVSAQQALDHLPFAASAAGIALRRDIGQRAIHLGDAGMALTQFQMLDQLGALQPHEARQWQQLLLDRRNWSHAVILQRNHADMLTDTGQIMQLAGLLADAGQQQPLRDLVNRRPDRFASIDQERGWFDLLRQAWPDNPGRLARYQAQYPQVRLYQAQTLVPLLLAKGATAQATQLLRALPAAALPRERFQLALASGDIDVALRRAQMLLVSGGNRADDLNALSYQLMQAGADDAAARLLLDYLIPPHSSAAVSHGPDTASAWQRLALLASRSPSTFDADMRTRLVMHAGDADGFLAPRARVLVALHDCDSLLALAGDLSASLEPLAWRQLGQCWQQAGKPGLAEYGYERAWTAAPDHQHARFLAMQAYTASDYPKALHLWEELHGLGLEPNELQSAVRAALGNEDHLLADTWLARWAKADGQGDPEYWWLRAQRFATDAPAQAIANLERALALNPQTRYWRMQAQLHQRLDRYDDAVQALRNALAMSPQDSELLAELGYAQLRARQPEQARGNLLAAARQRPEDGVLAEQLAYLAADAGDNAAAREQLRAAIDAIPESGANPIGGLPGQDAQRRFALRRDHEQRGRRLSLSADLLEATASTPSAQIGGSTASYRSFGQLEASWRLFPNIADQEVLTAYARMFAGSGTSSQLIPREDAVLGIGVRWKPLRQHTVFLALERQYALGNHAGSAGDTMLRVSASLFGNDRFSDDWHPRADAWLAQSLYLDLAYLTGRSQTLATADYRLSRHHKLRAQMTFEPFGHLQWTALRDDHQDSTELRVGLGVRWNLWYDQDRYNAWRHRLTVGVERQYALKTDLRDRNAWAMTVGGRW